MASKQAQKQQEALIDAVTARVQAALGGVDQGRGQASGARRWDDPLPRPGRSRGASTPATGKASTGNAATGQTAAKTSEAGAGGRPELARFIDHTLLKMETTREALDTLCDEARAHHFFSVCVNAANVSYCAGRLRGSGVRVCAVVGFPLGAMTPEAKAFETRQAIEDGASEIDMVLQVGALKSKDYAMVLRDIEGVVAAAKGHVVKVILETAELNDEEKIVACALSKVAGAHFVKTSTGFGSGGATVPDVTLMKRIVGDDVEVKASGGVRSAADADTMIAAGASRLGCSSSVAVVTGGRGKGAY